MSVVQFADMCVENSTFRKLRDSKENTCIYGRGTSCMCGPKCNYQTDNMDHVMILGFVGRATYVGGEMSPTKCSE